MAQATKRLTLVETNAEYRSRTGMPQNWRCRFCDIAPGACPDQEDCHERDYAERVESLEPPRGKLVSLSETRSTVNAKPVLRLQLFGCHARCVRIARELVAQLRIDVAALPSSERRIQRFDLSYSAPIGSVLEVQVRAVLDTLEPARRWIRGTLLEAVVE